MEISVFLIFSLICGDTPPIFDDHISGDYFEGASAVTDTSIIAKMSNVVIGKISYYRSLRD